MVVTESWLHAVRYKQSFDRSIQSKGYTDIRTLVAFSGTVDDPDALAEFGQGRDSYTEVGMNEDIKESELPKQFDTDRNQVMLVAEKYQTGFDQPLLHTMYVDRKLSGLRAVQTLSRLNRTCSGKEESDLGTGRDDEFRRIALEHLLSKVYSNLKQEPPTPP